MIYCMWTQEAAWQYARETQNRYVDPGTLLSFDNGELATVHAPRHSLRPSPEVLAAVEWIGSFDRAVARHVERIRRDITEWEQRADFERRMMQQYPASSAAGNYHAALTKLEALRKALASAEYALGAGTGAFHGSIETG